VFDILYRTIEFYLIHESNGSNGPLQISNAACWLQTITCFTDCFFTNGTKHILSNLLFNHFII